MLQSTNTATPARPHALSGRNRIKLPDPHAGYCFSPYCCCCCCLPVFHGGLFITVSFNTGQSSQFLAHACECESYSIHGKGVIAGALSHSLISANRWWHALSHSRFLPFSPSHASSLFFLSGVQSGCLALYLAPSLFKPNSKLSSLSHSLSAHLCLSTSLSLSPTPSLPLSPSPPSLPVGYRIPPLLYVITPAPHSQAAAAAVASFSLSQSSS